MESARNTRRELKEAKDNKSKSNANLRNNKSDNSLSPFRDKPVEMTSKQTQSDVNSGPGGVRLSLKKFREGDIPHSYAPIEIITANVDTERPKTGPSEHGRFAQMPKRECEK